LLLQKRAVLRTGVKLRPQTGHSIWSFSSVAPAFVARLARLAPILDLLATLVMGPP
jgi:hypothetical protein